MKFLSVCTVVVLFVSACENKKDLARNPLASDSIDSIIKIAQSENPNHAALALELLRKTSRNDSVIRQQTFEVASIFYENGDNELFRRSCELAIDKTKSARDTTGIARAYRYLAEYYLSESYGDSAFQALKISEKLYRTLAENVNLARVLYKKSLVQYDGHDILGADLSITQAYAFIKGSEEDQLTFSILSMSGIIANALEDYPKAIDYHSRALKVVKKGSLDRSLNQEETTLNNLGAVYHRMGEDEKAIEKFEEALSHEEALADNPALEAMLLDNLGYSKFKLGEQNEVQSIFIRALKIRDSLGLASYSVISHVHLSEFFNEQKDEIRAIYHANKAMELADSTNARNDLLVALKNMSQIDRENSSYYTKRFISLNDEVQRYERRSRDKFAKFELETSQIRSERNKLAEQNRTLLYFFVCTFTVGSLLFIIRTQRAKNRELLLKQVQQKANEEIYNIMIRQQDEIEKSRLKEKVRIAQELHDGILGRLFGTRLNLDSLNKNSDFETIEKRGLYLNELKKIEQDIREISHDLNREKNELTNNFISVLNKLIDEQRLQFKGRVEFYVDPSIGWDRQKNALKINSYRIIQESLQNINKYANATEIKVAVRQKGEVLVLTIEDNGIGFDVSAKKKGIGLRNILARANELEGTFTVRSKRGQGTSIIVTIPIN